MEKEGGGKEKDKQKGKSGKGSGVFHGNESLRNRLAKCWQNEERRRIVLLHFQEIPEKCKYKHLMESEIKMSYFFREYDIVNRVLFVVGRLVFFWIRCFFDLPPAGILCGKGGGRSGTEPARAESKRTATSGKRNERGTKRTGNETKRNRTKPYSNNKNFDPMKKTKMILMLLLLGSTGVFAQKADLTPADFDGPAATFIKQTPGVATTVNLAANVAADTVYARFGADESLLPFVLTDTGYTMIYNTVAPDTFLYDTIRIYTENPENISHVYNNGGWFSYADVSRLENLNYLDLAHNYLEAIDLRQNKNLQFLLLNGNSDIKTLDVTQNTRLEHLNVELLGIDSLDVSHIDNLLHLNIGYTNIAHIDLDSNLNLYELIVSGSKLTELNTSRFPNLQYLGVSYVPISKLDLSQNQNLYQLFASGMKGEPVTYIDVTHCPKLQIFFAMDNALEKCDFSQNPDLFSVYICQNRLTELDFSNNPNVIECSVWGNNLRFSTMPHVELSYYSWNPMAEIPMEARYKTGEAIDLSSELMVNDVRTQYTWKTGTKYPYVTLLEGVDYTIENGVTVFLRAQADPVFCEMQNDFFGSPSLKTAPFEVYSETGLEQTAQDYFHAKAGKGCIRMESTTGTRVSVFNVRGMRVHEEASLNGMAEIEVPAPGLYMVRWSQNGRIGTEKVVVL